MTITKSDRLLVVNRLKHASFILSLVLCIKLLYFQCYSKIHNVNPHTPVYVQIFGGCIVEINFVHGTV